MPSFSAASACAFGRRVVGFSVQRGKLVYHELLLAKDRAGSARAFTLVTDEDTGLGDDAEVGCCLFGGEILVLAEASKSNPRPARRFAARVAILGGGGSEGVRVTPLQIVGDPEASGRPFLCWIGGSSALLQYASSVSAWTCTIYGAILYLSDVKYSERTKNWPVRGFGAPPVRRSDGTLFTAGGSPISPFILSISFDGAWYGQDVAKIPGDSRRWLSTVLVADRFLVGTSVGSRGHPGQDFWVFDTESPSAAVVSDVRPPPGLACPSGSELVLALASVGGQIFLHAVRGFSELDVLRVPLEDFQALIVDDRVRPFFPRNPRVPSLSHTPYPPLPPSFSYPVDAESYEQERQGRRELGIEVASEREKVRQLKGRLREQSQKSKRTVEGLQQQASEMEREFDKLMSVSKDRWRTIEALQGEIEELERDLRESQRTVETLTFNIKAKEREFETERAAREKELARARSDLEDAEQHVGELLRAEALLEKRLRPMRAVLSDLDEVREILETCSIVSQSDCE